MDILILGGTVFLGRALTDAAIAGGHRVTHFNRGRSGGDDPRVATVHGDRTDESGLEALASRGPWDAVIDTSGYLPQVVQKSLDALGGATKAYAFVSTISVYADFSKRGVSESSPVREPPAVLPDSLVMELYGELKAGCEQRVVQAMGERALIVRPGLIVGPHDSTDRFTYWPARLARGGEVLAPGAPSTALQFIDVRDLARFTVSLVERGEAGVFNATGLAGAISMGDVIAAARDASHVESTVHWVDEGFLLEQGVGPWREMPLWIPASDEAHAGHSFVDVGRAVAAGLAFRPLELTVRDTLAWSESRRGHAWKAGLSAEREAELLGLWLGRNGTPKTPN